MRYLVGVVLVGLVCVPTAWAQYGGTPWRFVQDGAGTLYVIRDSARYRVAPSVATDTEMALPLAGDWGDTLDAVTAVPAPGGMPRTLATWRGNGTKTTEPITVTTGTWRIAAMVTRQLCISVYRVPDVQVQAGCLRQSDTTYVYSGPGTYYLTLASIDPWVVSVDEVP